MEYDVVVIGAGVIGSAVARELARRKRRIAVLERASDVCEGTSKANSGIVHAGYDAKPGSLKAKFNVWGNERIRTLSKELDFPFLQNGSMVLCFEKEQEKQLLELKERGERNGVKGLQILSGIKARAMEPALKETVTAALLAPTGGIVCPFGMTIAFAENAAVNGAEFFFETEVRRIYKKEEGKSVRYVLDTGKGTFEAKAVVNAAGVYADVFHNMVSAEPLSITARKGEYCLLDKKAGNLVSHTVFQLPDSHGKGVLVTQTVHGNLLLGPTAEDIDDKEAVNTTKEGMDAVLRKAALSVREIQTGQIITSFAGLRAHEAGGDFVLGEAKGAPGFFDAAGIESPGLTSAPAIGEYLAELVQQYLPAAEKESFIGTRKGIPNFWELSLKEQEALIRENPAYAQIVCRCEKVTEGEILAAIHRPLGATTLDGVKRRTRAGMGRCQAGFCAPKTIELLARELHKDISEIKKAGSASYFLEGRNKDGLPELTRQRDGDEQPGTQGRKEYSYEG